MLQLGYLSSYLTHQAILTPAKMAYFMLFFQIPDLTSAVLSNFGDLVSFALAPNITVGIFVSHVTVSCVKNIQKSLSFVETAYKIGALNKFDGFQVLLYCKIAKVTARQNILC